MESDIGNAKNPWVKALTFAIETASAHDKDDAGALAAITSYLHAGHGLAYDIVAGDSAYASSHLGGTMQLTKYIDKSLGDTVNCYDQASGVCSFGRLLGIDVTYRFMKPFGYINTVNLVGKGNCNNPFYDNPGITGGRITGSDQIEPVRAAFVCGQRKVYHFGQRKVYHPEAIINIRFLDLDGGFR